jgi:hypothetical protein
VEFFRGDYPADHIHAGLTSAQLVSVPILSRRADSGLGPVSPPRRVKNADKEWRIEDGKNIPAFHSTPIRFFIAGPTAVGKSAIALALAEKIGGEIISVDSMQVYRGLDIGTAKPSAAERARVPHHLIDVCDLHGGLRRRAIRTPRANGVAEIQSRGAHAHFLRRHRALFQGVSRGPGRSARHRSRNCAPNWTAAPLEKPCWRNCANAIRRPSKKLTAKIRAASSAPWKSSG